MEKISRAEQLRLIGEALNNPDDPCGNLLALDSDDEKGVEFDPDLLEFIDICNQGQFANIFPDILKNMREQLQLMQTVEQGKAVVERMRALLNPNQN